MYALIQIQQVKVKLGAHRYLITTLFSIFVVLFWGKKIRKRKDPQRPPSEARPARPRNSVRRRRRGGGGWGGGGRRLVDAD